MSEFEPLGFALVEGAICNGTTVAGGAVMHERDCPMHGPKLYTREALAAAELRGRQWAVTALRDRQRRHYCDCAAHLEAKITEESRIKEGSDGTTV